MAHLEKHVDDQDRRLNNNNYATNDGGDYEFPNPLLMCDWYWDDEAQYTSEIVQSCSTIQPNVDQEEEYWFRGYWVDSQCTWQSAYDTDYLACQVSLNPSDPHTITIHVNCSTNDLMNGMGIPTACVGLSATIPIQDATCEKCQRRHLEEDEEEIPEECQHCYNDSETCSITSLGRDDSSGGNSNIDYHGIPWSDHLIETMQGVVAAGDNHINGNSIEDFLFYEGFSYNQASLLANNFAMGMVFDCENGVTYVVSQSGELTPLRHGRRNANIALLGATILLLVTGIVAMILQRRHRRRQQARNETELLVNSKERGVLA